MVVCADCMLIVVLASVQRSVVVRCSFETYTQQCACMASCTGIMTAEVGKIQLNVRSMVLMTWCMCSPAIANYNMGWSIATHREVEANAHRTREAVQQWCVTLGMQSATKGRGPPRHIIRLQATRKAIG